MSKNAAGRDVSGNKNPNWKGGNIEKICVICGKKYFVIPSRISSMYCSLQCVGVSQRGRPGLSTTKGRRLPRRAIWIFHKCVICESSFEVLKSTVRPRSPHLTCSRKCYGILRSSLSSGSNNGNYKAATIRKCETCNTKFIDKSRNKRKYCSRDCFPKRMGDKAPAWKGGRTPLNLIIRGSGEYVTWRNLVFERDNFTCQKCGQYGGKLTAHHIKAFSDYPEFRMEISNGETCCRKCHHAIHRGQPRPGRLNV